MWWLLRYPVGSWPVGDWMKSDVHAPFQSKPELIEKWKQKVDPNNPQHSPTMAAMIEVLDSNVGRLMAALKENGLDKNTIVVFISDNGPEPGKTSGSLPYRGSKWSALEGGTRVPGIINWPGVVPAGQESDALIAAMVQGSSTRRCSTT